MDQGWHEDPRRKDRDPWLTPLPTKEEVITTERCQIQDKLLLETFLR